LRFEVYLSEAVVDVHSSNVVSEKPVEVRMLFGSPPNGEVDLPGPPSPRAPHAN
jgi:hypothetical protein